FLHDVIYTLKTWDDTVCVHRPDLHQDLIHITERSILDHVNWRISAIADDDNNAVGRLTSHVFDSADEASRRYEQFIPPEWIKNTPPDRVPGSNCWNKVEACFRRILQFLLTKNSAAT